MSHNHEPLVWPSKKDLRALQKKSMPVWKNRFRTEVDSLVFPNNNHSVRPAMNFGVGFPA